MFACFNFLGMLLASYLRLRASSLPDAAAQCIAVILAGLCFGLASTVRGNGLLSILVFVEPGLILLGRFLKHPSDLPALLKLLAVGTSALIILVGAALPQYYAYTQYCMGQSSRPWCHHTIPSIYNWVQQHYWDTGLFRYWAFSNIPLFLLAIPMLTILLLTGSSCLIGYPNPPIYQASDKSNSDELIGAHSHLSDCMRWFALPQIVLALLALTSFHVQIINRISTGYPVWYIMIAFAITSTKADGPLASGTSRGLLANKGLQKWLVRSMIIYAMVQGGLFASFLPPA